MKIGVVVATYNGEKYIEEQLKSILEQTMRPDMVVISDGKSSDATIECCKRILGRYNTAYRILTSEKQLQVSENFQKGLEYCDCDFIFFSDQDDVWLPQKIETIVNEMSRNDAQMAFTNAYIVDQNLKSSEITLWESIGFKIDNNITLIETHDKKFILELLKHNVVTGMCVCITKEIKMRLLPFPEGVLHDKWIAFISILFGRVVAIDVPMVLYRQHKNNVVGTKTNVTLALRHSKYYFYNVVSRNEMIKKIYSNSKIADIPENVKIILEEYINYLQKRIHYMQKEKTVFFLIRNIGMYKKYEYNFRQIMLKDFFVRIVSKEK
ncbi:MAG: glycosyltransferase [Anaerosacchariphilus sp.]